MLKLIVAGLVAFFTTTFALGAERLGIATGREGGTYYRFGQDIQRVGALSDLDVFVYQSKGTLQNLAVVQDRSNVQLIMSQADAVAFFARFGTAAQKTAVDRLRVVMPLYTEEVHVLASKEITSFRELDGKRVATGEIGSGTSLTSRVLFDLAGIAPGMVFTSPLSEAIDALTDGSLDALIAVGGSPIGAMVADLPANADIHLLPLDEDIFAKSYGPSIAIPDGTYPWQHDTVATVGILSMLVTVEQTPESATCRSIYALSDAIITNIDWLEERGHPKWSDIDLEVPISRDARSGCSVLYGP